MKDYEKLSRNHFDNQARDYDKNNTMYYSKEGKISCKDITLFLKDKNFDKLLDVGSGTGYLLDLLSREHEGELYGVDLSGEMTKVAQEKNIKNAHFKEGPSNKLPFPDETFDVVTCSQSFHHYPYREEAMNEAKRVLKKGGYYILSDTGVGGIAGFFYNRILFPFLKSGDYHTTNKKGIRKLMEKCGFHIEKCYRVEGFIYTVIGKK